MPPVVETSKLTKRYGRQTAVDQLSLVIEPGEIFGLLGPNGAGKTTILLMLLGLSEPTSGTARVLGLDPAREPLKVKRQVGYLPENVGFYEDLTAAQNLAYVAALNNLKGRESRCRVAAALEKVGLSAEGDKAAAAFSRGMRQRLGLAELLVKEPRLIFLDEPTLGLDPDGINKMLALIAGLSRNLGLTVVLSSHLLHLVERLCTRVAILKKGRLMASGSVAELGRAAGRAGGRLEDIYLSFFQNEPGPETEARP